MPIPLKVAVAFTPIEMDAMRDAAKLINNTIKSKIEFNMSTEEREDLNKMKDVRLPYALRGITEFGVNYPHLNGPAYTQADAKLDLDVFGEMMGLESLIEQAMERVVELRMAAGHFAWEFTGDQYANAQRNKDKNVEGAQVVYDAQKGAFEGQGPQGGNVEP